MQFLCPGVFIAWKTWSPCTQGQTSLPLILLPVTNSHGCLLVVTYFAVEGQTAGIYALFLRDCPAVCKNGIIYMWHKHLGQSCAVTLLVLAREGKAALEGFCSTFPWGWQCLSRKSPHLFPGYRDSVRPGSLLKRRV